MTNVIQEHITRRKAIVAGTTTVLGATGLALGTREAGAQAAVYVGELSVPDKTISPEDGAVYALWAVVSGTFEYRVDADPDVWEAYLLVYDGDGNSEAVGITDGPATSRQNSGSYALRGPITAASFWGPEDFTVPDGEESISQTIPIEIAFLVRDSAGDMLIQARAADEAVVTVDREGQVLADLAGTAEIVAQEDSSDPTPSVPEA